MKLFFGCIFFLATNLSFSQTSKIDVERENIIRVGAKAGVNINRLDGQSYKSGFNYNYLLGGFMQFNFSKIFGIQPEVNFVQASSHFTTDATDVYDDLFAGGSQRTAKLNYIKVPILLNINIGESKRVKLQVGPQVAGLLKETVDSLRTNLDL